jgi:hypothetical protein
MTGTAHAPHESPGERPQAVEGPGTHDRVLPRAAWPQEERWFTARGREAV